MNGIMHIVFFYYERKFPPRSSNKVIIIYVRSLILEPFLFINGVKLNQLFQRLNNISFISIDASAIPINQIIACKVIDGLSPDTITFSVKNTKSIGIITYINTIHIIGIICNEALQKIIIHLNLVMVSQHPDNALIM